jgi:hypothetical protein
MSSISPTVSGITYQTGPPSPGSTIIPLVYATGNCKTGCTQNSKYTPCKPGDIAGPALPDCGSCTTQNFCYSLDSTICPSFSSGAVTGIPSWTTSDNLEGPNGKSVTCTYNSSSFNNIANVAAWNNAFGTDDSYNLTIMPNFCIQESNSCPNYPDIPGAPPDTAQQLTSGGQITPICSNFFDTGTAGQLCRAWAQDNPVLAKTAYENYCIGHNSPDCSCVNRANNSVYESIKSSSVYAATKMNNFNDGCWYLPCANSGLFLIPSDINPTSDCETQVCQQIQNYIDSGGTINVGPTNNSLNCTFNSPTGSNNGGSTGTNNGGTTGNNNQGTTGNNGGGTNNPNPTSESFWSKYKWLIIGIIAVILIIIVIFVVMSSRRKKAVPKEAVKK